MGLDKNFVVRNGLEISSDLIFADSVNSKVGIGTTVPKSKLEVAGDADVSGDFRATGIATVGGVFDVGIAGTALRVDNGTGRVGVNTGLPEYNLDVIGDTGISSHLSVGGITTSGILHVTGLTSSIHLNVTGVTTIADARINAGFTTVTYSEAQYLNVTGIGTAVTFKATDLTVSNTAAIETANVTTALNVSGTSDFTGNITVDGASLSMGDNDEIIFGDGSDYKVDFNGTSLIVDRLVGGSIIFRDGGTDKIIFQPQNATIIPATDSTGEVGTITNTWANGRFTNFTVDSILNVRDAIDLADSDTIRFGDGDDYKVNFDGTNFNINRAVGGNIFIQDGGVDKIAIHPSTVAILPAVDGEGVIGNTNYTWGVGRFTNFTVDSILSVRGALDLADNDKIRFGNGDDVRMYYDTSDFLIEIDAGDIIIRDNTTPRFTFGRSTGNLTATGAGIFSGDVSGSTITAGTGGAVSLSTNDGSGNANITFNHKGGVADQDGSAFRITGTTDSTNPARLDFNIYENITAGSAGTPSRILRLTPNQATIDGNANVTGIVTAVQFVGDGSNLTGIDSSGNFQGKFVVCQGVISTGIGTFGQIKVGIDSVTGNAGTSFITGFTSVTATKFYGDGANLTNTGATLSAASGSQRVVLTSLTSGTMTSATTDGDLTFNASTNTLSCTNFSGDGANLTNTGATLSASSGTRRLVTTSLSSGTMTSAETDPQLTFDASTNTLNCTNFSGDGSNITNVDAATVDGIDSSAFIRSNAADIVTANTTWNDNNAIRLGTDGDQRIYFNGDNTVFYNVNEAKGSYYFQGENPSGTNQNSLQLRHDSNDAYVRLFCSNTERLKTTTSGISVTGAGVFSGTVTANTFSGSGASLTSIPNSALNNSTISGVSLGSNLATLTRGSYLTGSNYNGSTSRTWAVDAATGNSAGKVVARDASGNFSAGTINAALNGTATNATNVRVDTDSSNSSTHYVTFAEAGGGANRRMKIDGGMTFNPSSNTLTVANLTGNASTATNANNAGTLDGYSQSTGTGANTIARRDGSGHLNVNYLFSSYVNMSSGRTTRNSDTTFYSSTDDYIRKTDATGMRSSLNVPTRTGGDASGTWSISISGNAATATSATSASSASYATSAGNADTVDSIHASSFLRSDTADTASGAITFNGTVNIRGHMDFSDDEKIYWGDNNEVWQYFDSSAHYLRVDFRNSPGLVYLDNGTPTMIIEDSGIIRPATHNNGSVGTDSIEWANGYFNNLKVTSTLDVRGAIDLADNDTLRFGSSDDVEFFFNGSSFYLDLNSGGNNFIIRDGTTTRYTFDDNGSFTATGNVTAYSDIKLKRNIDTIPDALEKVCKLRGVTYDRIDLEGLENERQSGVIAQEVEEVLPEVVSTNEEGIKSVAYGNMVGLLIESIKELKAEIETLKQERN